MTFKLADNEKWVAGYEGMYSVDTEGNVYSYKRGSKLALKPRKCSSGYVQAGLYKGRVRRNISIHRLVATEFINNPCEFPMVNHINGDKTNNTVANLEWCTHSDNMYHAYKSGLRNGETNGGRKRIVRIDKYGNETTYSSVSKASVDNNISRVSIWTCCSGKYKTAGGYKWRYAE